MKAFALLFFIISVVPKLIGQSLIVSNQDAAVIVTGSMPNVATDSKDNVHIVYGTGDSLMYVSSSNAGKSFSLPALIDVVPGLFSSAMRGPQIAATDNGIIITACTTKGNIYSFKQQGKGWSKAKVNDADEVAKEALMGLGADGLKVFAVWLAAKEPKGQYLYGAESVDGGKTWKKNILVYNSPGGSVCECCKPSVAVKGKKVYVMFRNSINGNRDLYLAKSANGNTFTDVQKLGKGSWKLNACPMDGGGLIINDKGVPQTVWRREGNIYACTPGSMEKKIGAGRGCTIAIVNNNNIYAWTEGGQVVILIPSGEKKFAGKGSLPIMKTLNSNRVICVWENNRQVQAAVFQLFN